MMTVEAARVRRHYVALAQADEDWRQTAASFALEGITLTEEDAERAERILADVLTLDERLEQVLERRRQG